MQETPWIDAFTDLKAELQTLSPCLALGDLNADNDYKLIISDFGNGIQVKLKVLGGFYNIGQPVFKGEKYLYRFTY